MREGHTQYSQVDALGGSSSFEELDEEFGVVREGESVARAILSYSIGCGRGRTYGSCPEVMFLCPSAVISGLSVG